MYLMNNDFQCRKMRMKQYIYSSKIKSMIQRIQTLWLFMAGLCFGIAPIPPVYLLQTQSPGNGVFSDQILHITENKILLSACILSSLLALTAIFLFNIRIRQALLSGMAAIIQLVGVLGVGIWLSYENQHLNDMIPGIAMILGVIGILFCWLANRAIRKDETLVRSMDRLR